MSSGKNAYKADISLAPGEYQFRYLVDNQEWKNDWDAPGYTASGYASDNCVLTLEKVASTKKAATKKSAAKKAATKKTAFLVTITVLVSRTIYKTQLTT